MRVHSAEIAPLEGNPKARPEVSLETLYREHQGKVADKWSTYLREYDRFLTGYRDRPISLLEIGVQNGGCLEIWARYFVNAQCILGCDINPECAKLSYEDPRVHVLVGDANSDDCFRRVKGLAPKFDIVIDDGSHVSSDIVRSFARYFPLLADDGIFIIEDLHCSYWHEFEGGLFHPHSSMTFLKRLADVINHEHWGVPRFRADLVQGVTTQYGVRLHEQDLRYIHSVEFCNSMCVIRKAPPEQNTLGLRTIVGTDAAVVESIFDLQGMSHSETESQQGNPWSTAPRPPEEEVPALRAEVAPLAEHLALVGKLQGELGGRDAALAASNQARAASEQRVAQLEQQIHALTEERARWQRALSERHEQMATLALEFASTLSAREKDARIARRERGAAQESLKKAEGDLVRARAELKKIKATASWRYTRPLRKVRKSMSMLSPPGGYVLAARRVRKVLRQEGLSGAGRRAFDLLSGRSKLAAVPLVRRAPASLPAKSKGTNRHDYMAWLRYYDFRTPEERTGLAARCDAFPKRPLISVVLPTYNANPRWLIEAVESVQQQIYPYWELCIVDDASTRSDVRPVLERLAHSDPRIRVHFRETNGHISLATNTGIEMANGEWVALLDHDDVLREHALFYVVEAINERPRVRLVYSDEDKLLESGVRAAPYFKPDWNPDLFLSHNMVCHLAVYRTELLREIGGCRQGFEGAQDYDLALRYTERLRDDEIHHIPRVLYSWRVHAESTASDGDAKPYAALAGKRALDEHFQRTGVRATAEIEPSVSYRIHYELPAQGPLVSIIIPTRNAHALVRQCVESVISRTTYKQYEILLIDNGSDDPESVRYFSQLQRSGAVRLIRDDRPFNYSALNNAAVGQANGEFVCLLNNDIEVISADWLSEMVSIGIQPGVGAVGARLWYPNHLLQHGGVILGIGGVAGHSHKGHPKGNRGYFARAALVQSFSAVTGACLLVRKELFVQVGGLNEKDLKIAFNDVDFCLRLRERGLRNVWTPYAELFHHESATRGFEDSPEKVQRFEREVRYMKARWGALLMADPAYNPNLTLAHEDFSWAWPSRVPGASSSVPPHLRP